MPIVVFPAPSFATPARRAALACFLRFGVVGTLGFVWDTATLYAALPWIGLYAAGLVSYVVAATLNWMLNRFWTFRSRTQGSLWRQWLLYMLANSTGFMLNRGTFILLVSLSPLCRGYPVVAVAAGAVAGLFVNFTLSSRVVFRSA